MGEIKTRGLIALSVAILLLPIAIYTNSNPKSIGDLGSLLGASSGILAIIWFYRGLRLQSIQINEQRKQFIKQYHLQHQDSRLNYLQYLSEKIYEEINIATKELSISDPNQLFLKYLQSISFYEIALESYEPNNVFKACEEWMKIEGPCIRLLSSVKDLIVIHKQRLGVSENDNDRDKDPAKYVLINGEHLLQQPLISSYREPIIRLSEQINYLSPGRRSMSLAAVASATLKSSSKIFDKNSICEEIDKLKKEDKELIPVICSQLDF